MFGVTVRWSLHAATTDVAERLREYVRSQSYGRATGMPGLHQTLWTLREGGSFGATYVWETEAVRAAFVERLRAQGSPVNGILGHSADAFEEFEVVAIAEGGAGMIVLPGQATGEDIEASTGVDAAADPGHGRAVGTESVG